MDPIQAVLDEHGITLDDDQIAAITATVDGMGDDTQEVDDLLLPIVFAQLTPDLSAKKRQTLLAQCKAGSASCVAYLDARGRVDAVLMPLVAAFAQVPV